MLVAGNREVTENQLAVRMRSGKDLGSMDVKAVEQMFAELNVHRGH